MSAVHSTSKPFIPSTPTPRLGSFETNSRNFGPTVASAIGLADVASSAVGSTYTFSDKALSEFEDAGKQVSNALGGAVSGTVKAFEKAVDGLEDGAKDLAHDISSFAHDSVANIKEGTHAVLENIRGAVHAVEDGATSVASAVEDAASSVAHGLSTAVSNVTNYAALGVGAGQSLINEVA